MSPRQRQGQLLMLILLLVHGGILEISENECYAFEIFWKSIDVCLDWISRVAALIQPAREERGPARSER